MIKTVLKCCILLLSIGKLNSQFIFSNLTPKDGLNGAIVYSIIKDSEGFIWAGTDNGLNRFDGSNFKVYNNKNKNFPILLNEKVSAIIEYRRDQIWIGTTKGLYYLDKQTAKFIAIPFVNNQLDTIPGPAITSLLIDHCNQLWVGTETGLYILNNNRVALASNSYSELSPFDHVWIIDFCYNKNTNELWILSMKGLVKLNLNNNTVEFEGQNPNKLTLLTKNPVASMAIDKNNNIWFSDRVNLFAFYDTKSNLITNYSTFGKNPERKVLKDGISKMYFDRKDRLWISTYYYKSFVKTDEDKFVLLPNHAPKPFQPNSGFFYDFIEDNENTMWIGTHYGISKLEDRNPIIDVLSVKSKTSSELTDIALINNYFIEPNHNIWIGKDDGLYYHNYNNRSLVSFNPNEISHRSRSNRIFGILPIGKELYCATGNDIQILNPITKQFKALDFHPKLPFHEKKSITWIAKDSKGFLWFSYWYHGLCRYNQTTKEIIYFDSTASRFGVHELISPLCYLEVDTSLIWFGIYQNGIKVFNKTTEKFSTLKDSSSKPYDFTPNCMIVDKDQNIWVATVQRGILKLNINGDIIDSLNTSHGINSQTINYLAQDKYGFIWLTTAWGIYYFDPKDKKVNNLNVQIQSSFAEGWDVIKIVNDSLMISNIENIVIFNLSNIHRGAPSLKPLISNISVFEKDIPFSQTNTVLNLNYNQNFFSFEYSYPYYTSESFIKYYYKLSGFDKDWIFADRRKLASYTNVPDGDYQFMVKCIDHNGRESETNSLNLHISPPFFKSWWFLLFLILSIVISIIWIINRRNAHQRSKNISKALDYFVNSTYGENSVNEICWDIARNCISQLHFEDCVVYLLDEKSNKLIQKSAFGPKNPYEHHIINPIEIEIGNGIVGTAASTGKPLLINDTTKDLRYIVDDVIRHSELAVPIIHDQKVIGIIDSEHRKKNFFNEEHIKVVSSIASISSNKIAEAMAEANAKENELKLLEINKILAETQLMALRAQMNPHFVFNCLNSIQECIVTQKYGEASNYLNKFSKLFRTVLNNSTKNLVSIAEEQEVLELYLVLEHMRFEKSFNNKILLDEDLDIDDVMIPSMLIQPYVENALWHGLMHKEGDRQLNISFNRINEHVFQCIIEDNGIGRNKSFELKAQQSKTKRHESKGLKISKDRLDVLNKQGYHTHLEIIDKPNHSGTKVIIELSSDLNY